jgi:hypothetical protein
MRIKKRVALKGISVIIAADMKKNLGNRKTPLRTATPLRAALQSQTQSPTAPRAPAIVGRDGHLPVRRALPDLGNDDDGWAQAFGDVDIDA